MFNEFITAIFGFVGVLIGSFIPIFYQTVQDRNRRKKYLRELSLEKINTIAKNLNNVEEIINIIINFMDDDYNDNLYDIDRNHNFDKLCKIYSKNYSYFWDNMITDLYLLLPNATRL